MPSANPILKTVAIKNYLTQCIRRARMEPERLPGEIALCEKFRVSRITVRRAIEELEHAHYIIRLPGRKGAFTNPEMAHAVPYILGILSSDGKSNYFSPFHMQILSDLTREIRDIYCDTEFVLLNASEPVEVANEIRNLAYDALLWFSPPEQYIPVLNTLIREQYPILVQASLFSEEQLPASNSISLDFGSIGIIRARNLLASGARNIIYAGTCNSTFQSFLGELNKKGILFPKKNLIETPEDIRERLPQLLSSENIDSIVSDGGIGRYRHYRRAGRGELRPGFLYGGYAGN